MSVKFFINSQTIGRLGAAAVGYATAHRFGLNRTAVATVMIFNATLGTWSGQLIRAAALSKYPQVRTESQQFKVDKKRLRFTVFLSTILYPLITKTAQIAVEKLGSPLSFIQCVGVANFYGNVIGWPLSIFIGDFFPKTEYK